MLFLEIESVQGEVIDSKTHIQRDSEMHRETEKQADKRGKHVNGQTETETETKKHTEPWWHSSESTRFVKP